MFHRHIQEKLLEALEFMPIVLLRGARQTGKTTLTRSIHTSKYHCITFDHLPTLSLAKSDPVGFIAHLEKPVILDEIQRVPELFLLIKNDVDQHRIPGRYILTSSADTCGNALAGRMRLLTLCPFSQGEIIGKKEHFLDKIFSQEAIPTGKKEECSKADILQLVCRGGYPAALKLQSESQKQDWFNDYISLFLQKDVLDLSRIEKINQMPNLLLLLASRSGGLLNVEELCCTVKMSNMTLHRYLELLRILFLIFLLPPWSGNIGKRLVKSPKIYLNDTALQLFLLNVDYERLKKDPNLIGTAVENFVVLELLKQISWSKKNIQMYHYRDYKQAEIDIILEGPGGDLVAIEIKSRETIGPEDFKSIKQFQETGGKKFIKGIVFYSGNVHLNFGDNLIASPIASLWS